MFEISIISLDLCIVDNVGKHIIVLFFKYDLKFETYTHAFKLCMVFTSDTSINANNLIKLRSLCHWRLHVVVT